MNPIGNVFYFFLFIILIFSSCKEGPTDPSRDLPETWQDRELQVLLDSATNFSFHEEQYTRLLGEAWALVDESSSDSIKRQVVRQLVSSYNARLMCKEVITILEENESLFMEGSIDDRIFSILMLMFSKYVLEDCKAVITLADSLKTLESAVADPVMLGRIQVAYARASYCNDDFQEALMQLKEAETIFLKHNMCNDLYTVYSSLGILYESMYENDSSVYYFTKILDYDTCMNPQQIKNAQQYMAVTLGYMGHYNEALSIYKKLLLSEAPGSIRSAIIKINIGTNFFKQFKNADSALIYLEQAKEDYVAIGSKDIPMALYSWLGHIYLQKNDLENAYQNLNTALQKFSEPGTQKEEYLLYVHLDLATYYRLTNQFDKARRHLTICEEYLEQNDWPLGKVLYLKDLMVFYEAKEDYREAFETAKQYASLNQELKYTEKEKEFKSILAQYETLKLREENQRRQFELEQARQREQLLRTRYVAAVAAVMVLLVAGLLVSRLLELRRRHATSQLQLERSEREKLAMLYGLSEHERTGLQHQIGNMNNELQQLASRLMLRSELLAQIRHEIAHMRNTNPQDAINRLNQMLIDLNGFVTMDASEKYSAILEQYFPGFAKHLQQKFPDLTSGELKLASLLLLELDMQQIAMVTLQSANSLRVMKHRIRQKMNITTTLEEALLRMAEEHVKGHDGKA